ncbi:MAG: RsmE family RNA methyltransferase, partial [Candidatus Izemoplasmatales bacterium]
ADYIKPSELNLEEYENKFVCFAREGSNLISREIKKSDLNGKTLVAIGPEGGFTEQEITQFISLGFISVSLGNTILRAETAAIYVTGLFRYLEEEKK